MNFKDLVDLAYEGYTKEGKAGRLEILHVLINIDPSTASNIKRILLDRALNNSMAIS